MGAVQRLATIVIVGLVALSTVLVLYLADESNRIEAEEREQQAASIERATEDYISLCLSCHGPAGLGYTEPAERGTGRIGAALGGVNTSLNQEGINAQGTPYSGGVEARADHIRTVIEQGLKNPDGSVRMPAWSEEYNGPLNDEQINELVIFVQNADWNHVYNQSIEEFGGYPTAPPAAATEVPTEAAAPQPEQAGTYTVNMLDIAFDPTELTVPANTEITINLANVGAAAHNFNIDALGVASGDYAAGQTGTVTFNTGAPGEYEYYCSIPGHREAGMVGTLIVSESAPPPASEAPPPAEGDAPPAEGDTGAPAAGGPVSLDVEMVDIAFTQTELTVPAGAPVTVNLVNNGAAAHNFTIEELGVSSGDYAAGQTGTVEFTAPAEPGTYEYVCTIPGHREAGMVGKLIVQ